jgi:hypothetical protein
MLKKPMSTAATPDAQEPEEKHFKPREIAKAWNISETQVIRIFAAEPGVLKMGTRSPRRRTRVSLRIPESVLRRVHDRMAG